MNRLLSRINKLEKAKNQGHGQVHMIMINPGEDSEQLETQYMAENHIGENDIIIRIIFCGKS